MSYCITKNNCALLILTFFLLLSSCTKNSDSHIVYKKPLDEKLDATCQWLKIGANFYKSSYMPTFYNYYNEKLKNKNLIEASKALEIVSEKSVYHLAFDVKFQETLNDFSENYKEELDPLKATFIDSYYGNYYTDESKFKKAISYFQKVVEVPPNDYASCVNTARAYYDISFCYVNMGEQNLALENNFKALEYYKKTDNLSGIGNVYSSFSSIYLATKDFKKAHINSDKATAIYKKTNDIDNAFISLYNKIRIYDESKSDKKNALLDSTYNALKKSNIKDQSIKIMIDTYYVEKLLQEHKCTEAKIILDEIKPLVTSLNSVTSTQEYDVALALYEIETNKKNIDVSILKNAIPTLKENESYQIVINFYSLLKDLAVQKKDYKTALLYQEELNNANDSLASNEIRNRVIELDGKYQLEKKETQIALQNKAIENKNVSIAFLITFILGFTLLVVALTYIKKQKILKRQRLESLQYTKQLLEKTEEERQRIATDLHDSVSHELLNLKSSVATDFKEVNTKIDGIINDIRTISRNLHPVMFDKIGLQASVEQMVERVQIKNNFLVTCDINYNGLLSSNNELQVYRIIQEALSNIIKYADAVAAKISITQKNNKLSIIIKDNGKGFNVKETMTHSDAFGLHNIIERSRVIGGKATLVSDSNGTIITIEL